MGETQQHNSQISDVDKPLFKDFDTFDYMVYCPICKHYFDGWSVSKIRKEIASEMNDKRPELWKAIEARPSRILVENKDRLTRFGFNYLQRLLKNQGTEIIVINEAEEDREDLIKDLCSVIYSFCARLYGMRRAANKARRIREEIKSEEE